jgi:mRNA-degrading endonuclease RelE of RelBE toxin-antitoxin system
MNYIITYEREALRDFEELEHEERNQTLKKLYEVAGSEYRSLQQFDVRPMRNEDHRWRLRVGDNLRIILTIHENESRLEVSKIARRENLYQ